MERVLGMCSKHSRYFRVEHEGAREGNMGNQAEAFWIMAFIFHTLILLMAFIGSNLMGWYLTECSWAGRSTD